MESSRPPSMGKRLWHIVRVLYYMIRKGISKEKLMMDLQLLLKRGKIAGKALGNLMTFHHHHRTTAAAASMGGYYSVFSCRSMDPNTSFYHPREVEFSCSNTPSFPSFHAVTKRKNRHHHGDQYDAATIAKAFEILNSSEISDANSVAPSPSPAPLVWSCGKSPVMVRPLRITDSPFPIREEEGEVDGRVDVEAEDFIRRFYEQLRLQQQLVPATPDYRYRSGPLLGRA